MMLRSMFVVLALWAQLSDSFSPLCAGTLSLRCRAPLSVSSSLRASSKGLWMQTSDITSEGNSNSKGKLLVLGGTGFAGSKIVERALDQGYSVVAFSRRGKPAPGSKLEGMKGLEWRAGDATKIAEVEAIVAEGGFTGVVHAIGMLLESDLNKLASGSGSIPAAGSTYDDITRQTAFNLMKAFTNASAAQSNGRVPPFAFISAAEAGWTFDNMFQGTPAEWLHRYLVAKRAVEDELMALAASNSLRPIIVRPSLIWSWENPGALPPVAAFTIASKIGVPFIDEPVCSRFSPAPPRPRRPFLSPRLLSALSFPLKPATRDSFKPLSARDSCPGARRQRLLKLSLTLTLSLALSLALTLLWTSHLLRLTPTLSRALRVSS